MRNDVDKIELFDGEFPKTDDEIARFLFPAIFPKLSKENIQVILTCPSFSVKC